MMGGEGKRLQEWIGLKDGLNDSERAFVRSFETAAAPMALLKGRNIVACNEALLSLLGCPDRSRLIGKRHGQISAATQHGGRSRGEAEKELTSLLGSGGFGQFPWVYRTFDGRDIEVEVSFSRVPIGGVLLSHAIWRDLSGGNGTKTSLRLAEERYRGIFENAVSGIFQTTPEGSFLNVNPALASMCGFSSPKDMLSAFGRIEEQYVNPDDRNTLKRLMEDNGFVTKFETELYRKDNTTIWVSLSARAVRGENGEILYYEGFIEDVTQRKIAEEALLREKATFFTILDNDPVGVILSDRKGNYLFVNREFTNVTGYTREDVATGADWFGKAYPDRDYRRAVIGEWLKNASSEGGEWMDVEFSIVCKDGSRKHIEFRSTFLRDYSITVLKDVTKRKEAESALHESEEKFRLLFENATEGIFQTTVNGRIISANPAFAHLFGYESSGEILNAIQDVAQEIYANPARRVELKRALDKDGLVRNFEVQCRRRDGRKIWVSVNMRVVRRDGKVLSYEGTMTDVTERKSIQEDLEQKSQSLEEANAALRALLKHREDHSRELEEKIVSNVKELVLPYVERLKESRTAGDKQIVDIIESNLEEIMSPFIRSMGSRYADFTPREILIADLIKKGKSTKEMSMLLMLSTRTIDIHRYNIRRKLNLNRRRVNLQAFLLSLA